jgi:DNA-binding NarL/FixJ family response regulator
MVGRERELASIERTLRAVRTGTFAWVAVTGEPGIGKTFLLREMCHRAAAAGFHVTEGRGTALGSHVPLALAEGALAELDPLGPILRDAASAGMHADGAAERYAYHHAVRAALEEFAHERQPVLIALDDVHLGDDASLELIAHLLRHPPAGPVALALAFRQARAARLLEAALVHAERDGSGRPVTLGPLTEAAAARLFPPHADATTRRALYADSGGNPFYLAELARAPGADVPGVVQAAVEQELAEAPGPARQLLRAAAVVGDPFPAAFAAVVANTSEDEALALLDSLARLDIVRPAEEPGTWTFRHPVVRRAVYGSASPRARLTAHTRAARELERTGAPLGVRARHVERAAEPGDADAARLLAAAAREEADTDPAAAARWLDASLCLLPSGAAQTEPLIALGEALAASGEAARGREALERALQLVRGHETEARTRVVGAIARLDHSVGRHGAVRTLLAETPDLRAELLVDTWLAGDWHTLVREAGAVTDDADPALFSTAQALRALGCARTGATAAARVAAARAADLVDALSDDAVTGRMPALAALAAAEVELERYPQAMAHAERGIAHARGGRVAQLQAVFAAAAMSVGRLGDALAACGSAPTVRTRVLTLQGDLAGALAAGDGAVRSGSWVAHGALAIAEIEAGRAAAARSRLLAHEGKVDPIAHPAWYAELCNANLALGDIAVARACADRAHAAAAPLELHAAAGDALAASAAVALAAGDGPGAARAAHDAGERFATIARRIDSARASIIEARALALTGAAGCASELLERAFCELDACGADGYRDEAARLLRELGGTVPLTRSQAADSTVLTTREREVARLVGEGLKNREIATELFVSPKTVEKDLARVFRKLGVTSRAAVAAALQTPPS